jgi:hypothetical protein
MPILEKKIPKKRNGYYYRNGQEYISITKMIGESCPKPALMYWMRQQCTRIALKDPTLNEQEVESLFQLQNKKTQERGHYIHNCAEQMPNVQHVLLKPEYVGYYKALEAFWETFDPRTFYNELECFSDHYKVACRVDKVAGLNGKMWSLDFKTGKEVYKEVGIQLAFGRHALKEDHGIIVDHTGVVLLMDTGEYKFQETNDTIEDFETMKKFYEWLRRKG